MIEFYMLEDNYQCSYCGKRAIASIGANAKHKVRFCQEHYDKLKESLL